MTMVQRPAFRAPRIRSLACLLTVTGAANLAFAAPALQWVATHGDAGFVEGSEATASPLTTDADADGIAGSFPPVTLAEGETITLTGSVVITGRTGTIPGNQFRWGLFNAPTPLQSGSGGGYVGVWAAAPEGGSADVRSADGSGTNPFSSSASTVVSSAADATGDAPLFGASLAFSLTISRLDAFRMTTSATLKDGADLLVQWPATTTLASPSSFTYNAAAFLLGGGLDATGAAFSLIDVDASGTELDTDGDGMPDAYEEANGLNPDLDDADGDLDEDGLTNYQEFQGADGTPGTNDETAPNDPDSDHDGVNDGDEVAQQTDPLNADSDGDGLRDGVESNSGRYIDADDTGTDPLNPDSDGDATPDGVEVDIGTDPTDPASNLGDRLLGIDFNRDDALGSPSQSGFRVMSGSITQAGNAASYTKTIGPHQVTVSQPQATAFEFRGANVDSSRAIPGGDTSLSFLVADFIATQEGAIDIEITALPAGHYLFRSYHLDPFIGSRFGFAQGASSITPNTIEARVDGILQAAVEATALGALGLNTTFINDAQIPALHVPLAHDGTAPLTIHLSSVYGNGSSKYLLLNGFELYRLYP